MSAFSDEGVYVAFDTSSPTGSVAVSRGAEVLAHVALEYRGAHAGRLVPALGEALAEASIDRAEVAGIVVGEGPGSFTGVRVAAATAKGLAHAWRRPLWAISSLAATALSVAGSGVRYVLFDARSDRVYGACYGVGSVGVETLLPPHGGTLRDVLDGDVPTAAVFVGVGAHEHRAAIVGAGFPVQEPPAAQPSAVGLLRYMGLHPSTPPVADPGSWEPRYIREWRPDAAWRGAG